MPKIVAEKTQWLKLGFELFAEHGAAGLVVDKMARTLKCNRSSFYWHFESKKEFIKEIIDYWVETDTRQIIVQTEKSKSPQDKFKNLVKIVFKEDPFIDFVFHLKRFGRQQHHIRRLIDQIDNDRINYVSSVLLEMGYSSNEAKAKADLFYKYLIGYHEIHRYNKQKKTYVEEVFEELKQFISI